MILPSNSRRSRRTTSAFLFFEPAIAPTVCLTISASIFGSVVCADPAAGVTRKAITIKTFHMILPPVPSSGFQHDRGDQSSVVRRPHRRNGQIETLILSDHVDA